jgi:hypothetical protein
MPTSLSRISNSKNDLWQVLEILRKITRILPPEEAQQLMDSRTIN